MQIKCDTQNRTDFLDRASWYNFAWGLATIKDGNWHLMGRPEACKDYILDAFHHNDGYVHLNRKFWTEEALQSPHLYVIPRQRGITFIKGIKKFLNPYEIAHGFTPTTFVKSDIEGRIVYLITHDEKWCKTLIARSYYYSLLRMCAYLDVKKSLTNAEELIAAMQRDICSERTYIRQTQPYFDIFFKNPTCLLNGDYIGYPKEVVLTHGCTGLFYNIMMHIQNETRIKHNLVPYNIIMKHIEKILKEHNVKMQGV